METTLAKSALITKKLLKKILLAVNPTMGGGSNWLTGPVIRQTRNGEAIQTESFNSKLSASYVSRRKED